MAFLAKLFGKKKDNEPKPEALAEEEGLTPEEEAAAEAAEAALRNGELTDEVLETEEDVAESVEEPIEEAVEEPAEEIPEEIVEAVVEDPVEEILDEPVEEELIEEELIEEAAAEPVEEVVEEPAEEPVPVFEDVEPEAEEEPEAEPEPEPEEEDTTTKKSFWGRLKSGLSKTRNALFAPVDNLLKAFTKVDEDLLEELEEILISADVGFTATEEIMDELRERIHDGRLKEKEQVMDALREIMTDMIGESEPLRLTTTPSVLLVIGVNGAGKTTSIGKISKRLRLQGKKVVVAAADTFRAAAIDQLAVWCERAKVDMVKQNEGSDPAAVVFDAIAVAKKKQADVLIIDTAGRLQNKKNLMNELAKIDRVIDRELPGAARETLLVLDATTGQNAVSQAKEFSNAAKITGITLNKLDGTAKGGIIISIKRELGIPVKFVGVGEKIDDMQEFDAEDFVKALFGE